MKHISSIGLLAIVLLCGCATTRVVPPPHENAHTFLEDNLRYGVDVDSISEYSFSKIILKNGEIRTQTEQEQKTFNKWGNLVYNESRMTFQTNDTIDFTIHRWRTNTYNDLGQIVRAEEHDSEDGLCSSVDYTYTKRGLLETEVETYHPNCVPTTTKHTYDRYNNEVCTEYLEADSVLLRITYKYNRRGQLVEESSFRGADGALTRRTTNTYNRHGDVVKTVTLETLSQEGVIVNPGWPEEDDIRKHLNRDTWGKNRPPVKPIKLDTVETVYSYKSKGVLAEKRSRYSAWGGDWYTAEQQEYHNNGNLAKKTTWSNYRTKDGFRVPWVGIYNEQGLIVEEYHYSTEEKALRIATRKEYNDQGEEVLRMDYDSKGTLRTKTTTAYNSNGKVVEKWAWGHNGKVSAHEEHTYVGDVWMESKIYYDATRLKQHNFKTAEGENCIVYDKNGNVKNNRVFVKTPNLEWYRSYQGEGTDDLRKELRREIFRR